MFDKKELYTEVIKAIMEHGDIETMFSLIVADRSEGETDISMPSLAKETNIVPSFVRRTPGEMYVEVETVVYAVALAAVFGVVTIIVLAHTPKPVHNLSRIDLQQISSVLAEELSTRDAAIRKSGALHSLDSLQKGSIT